MDVAADVTVEPIREPSLKEILEAAYEADRAAGVLPTVGAIPLTLFANHVECEIDGIKKAIHISEFQAMIEVMSKGKTKKADPILLPFGCFAFDMTETEITMSCYYPEGTKEVNYKPSGSSGKAKEFTVPFPNLIINFKLKKGSDKLWSVVEALYYCTPKKVTQLPTENFVMRDPSKGVHRLPFPNIYGGDGMCYGNNTMPVKHNNNLRGLDYYYQILFIAPFNDDLGVSGLNKSYSPYQWFEYLATQKEFPYTLLR
jgi:hypothetical protein